MAEYRKEITADAHRILKDGRWLSSDEILGLLNGYEVANNLLADERDSLQSQLEAARVQCDWLQSCLHNIVENWDGPFYRREMLPLITIARAALNEVTGQSPSESKTMQGRPQKYGHQRPVCPNVSDTARLRQQAREAE